MLDGAQSAVEWAQGLPTITKGVASLVIVVLSVFLLFLLWQTPPEIKAEKQGAGAANVTGNVASSGQSGGVTAGLYINNQAPPVTDQQKEQALSSLQSEIEELAHFPNRPDTPEPRTLLEQVSRFKTPHQLFVILNKYYKTTILSVPKIGKELFDFKTNYYSYESNLYEEQTNVTSEIGKIVSVRFRDGWSIYFRYFLLRSAGLAQQQIMNGGDFLNYSITWEDTERVFSELSKNSTISKATADSLASQKNLLDTTNGILAIYKTAQP